MPSSSRKRRAARTKLTWACPQARSDCAVAVAGGRLDCRRAVRWQIATACTRDGRASSTEKALVAMRVAQDKLHECTHTYTCSHGTWNNLHHCKTLVRESLGHAPCRTNRSTRVSQRLLEGGDTIKAKAREQSCDAFPYRARLLPLLISRNTHVLQQEIID